MAAHRAKQAMHNAAVASVAIPPTGVGITRYEAADSFGEFLANRANKAETKRKAVAQAKQIKNATPDMPLEAFDYDVIQRVGEHWRSRPMNNRRGRAAAPLAIETIKNFYKITKRFVKWLGPSSAYKWHCPPGYEEALQVAEEKPELVAAMLERMNELDAELE